MLVTKAGIQNALNSMSTWDQVAYTDAAEEHEYAKTSFMLLREDQAILAAAYRALTSFPPMYDQVEPCEIKKQLENLSGPAGGHLMVEARKKLKDFYCPCGHITHASTYCDKCRHDKNVSDLRMHKMDGRKRK